MDQKILKELQEIKKALANVVTKDDLVKILANHPTKDDLKDALSKQSDDICKTMHDLFVESDEKKADRKDVEALEKRVTALEHN